ncbi:lysozyme inhibitor LprI family protein [Anabaena subtropica]|uniref:Lysozyme inhibitor LprI family protein n=1 Tax=Anabaena subtropica FACHB-260 TaxID=2692884 RepID=A0ABR8CLA3_9NOST|nr:lysozyme inhibitor LprI family protein [Anabaena subtropica]MBD2343541.1 lysozyme inhibitor LprI family protein [Anabaena subtropica FACHB-260]
MKLPIPQCLIPILACTTLLFPTVTTAKAIFLAQNINCNNAQTQLEINRCSQLSYQNADKKLNQVYKRLLPKLQRPRQQKLIAAQQAWIKFRDSSCEFESSAYEGGSIAPSVYLSCLEKVTKQRTQQLQEYLQADR